MSNRQRVYLDHAATTPVHPAVVEAMIPYFSQFYGNPSSFYQRGRESAAVLQDARGRIASLINADPREIFFTACGTEADNWAIKGAASRLAGKGRHIITSAIEHHAVLHACEDLQKQGFELTVLPVDGQGLVDPAAVKAAIRPDTILVTIMWANNEIGTIQPIREIAAICREQNVLFIQTRFRPLERCQLMCGILALTCSRFPLINSMARKVSGFSTSAAASELTICCRVVLRSKIAVVVLKTLPGSSVWRKPWNWRPDNLRPTGSG